MRMRSPGRAGVAKTLFLASVVLFGMGCEETSEICGLTPSEPGARDSYPASGQGTAECSVITDLSFTNSDDAEYSFGADVFADRTKKLLLISTTAGWCTACIEEQPVLRALHEKWSGKGLAIMIGYFEDSNFNPATAEDAASWKERYDLPFPVVADSKPFSLGNYYDETLTPMNMFVDVETMTILSVEVGFDRSSVEALIETWL